MEAVKILYLTSRSVYGELERKSLHLLSKLAEQPNIELTAGFLQDNPLNNQLTDLNIKCEVFRGYSGLIRYLQFNRFDVIHFSTSKRLYSLISQHGRNAALVESITPTSAEDSTSGIDRGEIWSIFDDPILIPQWNSPTRSTVLPPAISANLLSKSAKGFVKVQHALGNNSIIGVTCYGLEDLDINLLIRLAQTLRLYKDPCKIVVFCSASSQKMLVSRLRQATVEDVILVRELMPGAIAGVDVYLDTARRTVVRIDVLEALALKVPVVIPQNPDTEQFVKLLDGKGFLYNAVGSVELLRQYCLSALKLEPTTVKLPVAYSVDTVIPKLIGVYQNLFLEDQKSTPSAPTAEVVPASSQNSNQDSPTMDTPSNASDRTYYIVPYSIHGGAEVYLKNYLQRQPQNQVGLIFMNRGTTLEQELRSKYPYAVVNNPVSLGNYILANKIQKVCFYNSKAIYLLLARLKKMQMQSLHITEIVHSYFQWKDSMHGVARTDIDRIIVVSDIVAQQWRITNYEVIPPYIDENRFKIKKVRGDKTIVGTVARLSPEKNLIRVVDIAAEMDDNYQFVIVGQDGGTGTTLRNYIAAKGLRKRVIVKEYNPQIEKEYATFNLFLLTSHIEGTPMTILEALAAGLPVMAPDVGGIKKMLEGKDQCFVYKPSTSNADLAKKIRALTNPTPPTITQEPIIDTTPYDYAIISDVDDMLFFHTAVILKELLALVGKQVLLINKQRNERYQEQLKLISRVKAILLYRTYFIPAEVLAAQKSGIPVGYILDDNLIYENDDGIVHKSVKQAIRAILSTVDFCFGTPALVEEMKKYNPHSYFISRLIIWQDLLTRNEVGPPLQNRDDTIRIGVISGVSHSQKTREFVMALDKAISNKKVRIVYFLNSPLAGSPRLEYHSYVSFNPKIWYNKLHSLKLDLCMVEYNDHPIIRTKSNLKFKESANMKIPLLAIDPTQNIYKDDIINGVNGYTVTTREEAIKVLQSLIENKDLIRKLGEEAYNTLNKMTPTQLAEHILEMLNMTIEQSRKPLNKA